MHCQFFELHQLKININLILINSYSKFFAKWGNKKTRTKKKVILENNNLVFNNDVTAVKIKKKVESLMRIEKSILNNLMKNLKMSIICI